ncbi:5-guanidino-2-oxopentanoate decarboxylase [Crenobacter sp. SG2305]|uniref:5-guanidino-2-oxopentanoate decarboxylase n=1 Tax=Crenobacter oryzisoli TaxID=3056844 RepID=UPI0025AA5583|nr:5-guanidino-2-oxopentanoate decarboxylase [Crenobacter sp. SG2305]MDN0084189.1 5-guanidino-2-oxopentanoate decarboxylase [Crenobacter sp. SG2305]
MKTVGMYLTDLLAAYGVDTVFGIPGVHTVELYRGLADSHIRHVTARHEQSLGFMADGYARVSGKPGVCFVITGPGLTNIATAMGQAYADSIPMLVISGVNALGKLGSGNGHLHELPDQHGFAREVSAFSHTVTRPSELPQVLARAFAVFDGARPRPVHIEIPLDLMSASAEQLPAIPARPVRITAGPADSSAIAEAAQWLQSAERPLLLLGGGALAASDLTATLAERLDAPTVMTINARGLLPAGHPLGLSFSPSCSAVRRLAADSDMVLAIGTEIGQTDYDAYVDGGFALPGKLIRIDIDPEQLFRNRAADLALLGDARATVAALLEQLAEPGRMRHGAERALATRMAGGDDLSALMRDDLVFLHAVRDALPDARFVGDSTRQVYAGDLGFVANAPRSWFNASTGFGSLGYGLPAAVGAALAADQPVVCLVGDGGIQFTLAELGTAVETGARLIVLLLNNGGYGEIKAAMLDAGVPPVGVDLHTPDFVTLARAYGWHAERFERGNSIAELVRVAATRSQPTLIEILDHDGSTLRGH